jgi:large subunit ribosomal protein L3
MAIEGLLGRKLGMVQRFDQNGEVQGATVLEAGPCLVTQVKTVATDGYDAVQLGYGAIKDAKVNKPLKGHLRPSGGLFRHLREFSVDDVDAWKVGQRVGADLFKPGDLVDVIAVSKGRGFQGGVKRHGFHGGPKTHGQSDRHRAPGSIGSTTTPGRVLKGLRMAGHMGDRQVTVRNLVVLESNPARGILLLKGAVPGATNGLVRIRRAKSSRG